MDSLDESLEEVLQEVQVQVHWDPAYKQNENENSNNQFQLQFQMYHKSFFKASMRISFWVKIFWRWCFSLEIAFHPHIQLQKEIRQDSVFNFRFSTLSVLSTLMIWQIYWFLVNGNQIKWSQNTRLWSFCQTSNSWVTSVNDNNKFSIYLKQHTCLLHLFAFFKQPNQLIIVFFGLNNKYKKKHTVFANSSTPWHSPHATFDWPPWGYPLHFPADKF